MIRIFTFYNLISSSNEQLFFSSMYHHINDLWSCLTLKDAAFLFGTNKTRLPSIFVLSSLNSKACKRSFTTYLLSEVVGDDRIDTRYMQRFTSSYLSHF